MRNLYPNVMKAVVSCIFKSRTGVYINKLMKIRMNVITTNTDFESVELEEFLDYCEKMKKKEYGLKDIYCYMDYKKNEGKERTLKKMFQEFVVWFLERRYSVYVLRSDQCEHKEKYMKGKNTLRYLPDVRSKKNQV